MFEDFFDQYAASYGYAKPGRIWCYEDGCVYRGLLEMHLATGRPGWRAHLERLIAAQVDADGALRGYRRDEFNIDNILAGRVLFALMGAEDGRYDKALDTLAGQLAQHPRTSTGNYWHKKVYPHQVWLDGLYMGLPFQIEYGLRRNDGGLVDDAARQMLTAVALMRDEGSGLYLHGRDETGVASWADGATGLSASLWARANGWLAMALIDAYALLPETHPARSELRDRILSLAEAVAQHRTANGLWLQVMDRPDLAGNYEESSSSAMFAYFFLKSARFLDGAALLAREGNAALEALGRLYVHETDGVWRLDNICEVAGLGGLFGKPRDGTPGYYLSEPVVANDPKGVGPLMMAAAEQIRAADALRPAEAAQEASLHR